jgi:hypothetical protein
MQFADNANGNHIQQESYLTPPYSDGARSPVISGCRYQSRKLAGPSRLQVVIGILCSSAVRKNRTSAVALKDMIGIWQV